VVTTGYLIYQLVKEPCDKGNCAPCVPPVGTIAYREDTDPTSRTHAGIPPPHYQLYEMNQNPNNCQCFWQKIKGKDGVGPSPPPAGTVPITEPAGGGRQ